MPGAILSAVLTMTYLHKHGLWPCYSVKSAVIEEDRRSAVQAYTTGDVGIPEAHIITTKHVHCVCLILIFSLYFSPRGLSDQLDTSYSTVVTTSR